MDLDYYEARRQARSLLGPNADVGKEESLLFPARVGVWLGNKFILVGVGTTFREALADAKSRQEMLHQRKSGEP